jgi:protein RecA
VVSTGCETLGAAIGVGGFPMSRLSVITGGEGSGKTTFAGQGIRSVQKMGGIGVYIDNEFKLDLQYFRDGLGVDLSKMIVTQPATVEDSMTILNELLMKVFHDYPDMPVFGVLDSINSTKSSKEYEEDGTADFNEANQAGLGASARFWSLNLPKLLRLINQKPVALLFISQPREKIGTPGRNLVAGGNGPKFYAALVIEIFRRFKGGADWEESGRKVGSILIGKCIKNQVSTPQREAEIYMRFGKGVDHRRSLLDQAIKMLLLEYGGNWYSMPSDDPEHPIKFQGGKALDTFAENRADVLEFLLDKVREDYKRFIK